MSTGSTLLASRGTTVGSWHDCRQSTQPSEQREGVRGAREKFGAHLSWEFFFFFSPNSFESARTFPREIEERQKRAVFEK